VRDVDPRWYDGFFEAEWLDYLSLPGDHDATLRQVDFLVTGIDLSPRSLELARATAQNGGVEVALRCLDMRELDYGREFGGAINVFTSFGYFEEGDENERVLHGIAELGEGTRTILVAQEGA
jgi:SAM-dependent methyltransferase